jgi:hypothetical protein
VVWERLLGKQQEALTKFHVVDSNAICANEAHDVDAFCALLNQAHGQ